MYTANAMYEPAKPVALPKMLTAAQPGTTDVTRKREQQLLQPHAACAPIKLP
jgi:hypothetical protein